MALWLTTALRADDGYRLWLRYDPVPDAARRAAYDAAISEIVVPEGPGPRLFLNSARDELVAGLRGLLGRDVPATRGSPQS
jgi:alpha-glucuronidase